MSHFPSGSYRLGAANRDPEEEALAWVVRLTSGEVSAEDEAEFAHWHQDEGNALAYRRAVRLWQGLGPILEEQEAAGWPESIGEERVRPVGRRFPLMARYAALAASLALVTLAGWQYLQVWQYDQVSGTSVAHNVPLADGTVLAMGPDSAISTDFRNGARHVALARGEVFFNVHHDAAHPFVVSAGKGIVRVLGTAFSVRKRDDGEVVVTVTRGKVQVTSGAREALLVPDRQVRFGEAGLSPVRAVDASLALAWTRGRLILENRPLADVLAELDRYHSGKILLLNPEAGERRINAVIDLGRIDSWLTALASSQGLSMTMVGPVTILR